jgi:hypothetical protein
MLVMYQFVFEPREEEGDVLSCMLPGERPHHLLCPCPFPCFELDYPRALGMEKQIGMIPRLEET